MKVAHTVRLGDYIVFHCPYCKELIEIERTRKPPTYICHYCGKEMKLK